MATVAYETINIATYYKETHLEYKSYSEGYNSDSQQAVTQLVWSGLGL